MNPITALHVLARNRLNQYRQKRLWTNYVHGDLTRPIARNRVNVYFWKHQDSHNVGDALSEVVVREVARHKGIDFDADVGRTRRLLAVGSVIHSAKCPMTVWGSGLHHEGASIPGVALDVRAVRGPLTRNALLAAGVSCPEVFGDPAILLPLFFQPEAGKRFDYTVIPHFSKEAKYSYLGGAMMSTLTGDWRSFIERIVASRIVISGSLHGLILAETYGVPAVALTDIDTDWFKYDDYYLSTGRRRYPRVNSVEEALALPAQAAPPDMAALREGLLASFPADLWNRPSAS